MTTTAIDEAVLDSNITITTNTQGNATILDDQWQIACVLIPTDRVSEYFGTPGDIETGVFTLLDRNSFANVAIGPLLEGATTFYNQNTDATLAYIVFTAPTDWNAASVNDLVATLTPIGQIIRDRTNVVFPAMEVEAQYNLTSQAIDQVALTSDFFTLRLNNVPASANDVLPLITYMEAQNRTAILLNNTRTLDGRIDFAAAANALRTVVIDNGTRPVGRTWQGNPLIGVSPTFVTPSGAVFQAIRNSPLSYAQRETPDSNAVVFMGGWAFGGYTERTPLSYHIFNTYARIQLRNMSLPLLTRRETRPVTTDDVNTLSADMANLLEPFVGSIIEVNTLVNRSVTPTELQDAIQAGSLTLMLSELIRYRLPRVVQEVNVSILAETV